MAKASAKARAASAPQKLAKDGTRRGGARIDPKTGKSVAGRKPVKREPTSLTDLDLRSLLTDPPPDEIDGVAQRHLTATIDGLVKIAVHGASETARISCCKEILDRGYGKPAVEIGGDAAAPMLPFQMAPSVQPAIGVTAAYRSEARKYARLAVEVLRRIAEHGQSETARASALKALNDRGLGTVAMARMSDEMRDEPVGKKEQQARAAATAASGKFATPAPPRRVETLQ